MSACGAEDGCSIHLFRSLNKEYTRAHKIINISKSTHMNGHNLPHSYSGVYHPFDSPDLGSNKIYHQG